MIRPLRDLVLIGLDPVATESGGVAIPDTVEQARMHAHVLAVGSGTVMATETGLAIRPIEVRPGDHVLVQPGSGTPITIDGERLILLHERLILGVIE